jgi:hypothetical protein|nr:MAG TPA: hypothetical protein [Caudoviricetes sp.]
MKVWNRVESYDQLPMAVRASVSGTLADWRSEANIKRGFGRVWISHCGAAYDLSEFRGVPRGTVRAIYYTPRKEGCAHKPILIVFDGVTYQVDPIPVRAPMEFRAERQLLARNYLLPL